MTELNLNEIKWHHERTLADDDQLTVSEHERGLLLAEVERLHSWDGLISLLDEHWPEDIFPTGVHSESRDLGPRIVSLVRWVERLTSEGVAASERRDYYKTRCEQMERDHAETVAEAEQLRKQVDFLGDHLQGGAYAVKDMVHQIIDLRDRLSTATRFEVSALPDDHDARRYFVLHVVHRGRGTWAVIQPWEPAACLGVDGEWDWQPRPSERTDEWISAHRFDLDTALRLAEEHAPKLVVNGRTAADVLARDAKREAQP